MKKTLLFLMILVSVGAKAQTLTLEESIRYITDKMNNKDICWMGKDFFYEGNGITIVPLSKISIGSNGKEMRFSSKTFEPIVIDLDLSKVLKIVLVDNKVRFYLSTDYYYPLRFSFTTDAERLHKAFNHLKSLLPKEKDPFDN